VNLVYPKKSSEAKSHGKNNSSREPIEKAPIKSPFSPLG